MIEAARRARNMGRYYAAGSIAAAAAIIILFPGIPGAVIGIAVILQGVAFAFLTGFWNGFETFAANSTETEAPAGGEKSRAASL